MNIDLTSRHRGDRADIFVVRPDGSHEHLGQAERFQLETAGYQVHEATASEFAAVDQAVTLTSTMTIDVFPHPSEKENRTMRRGGVRHIGIVKSQSAKPPVGADAKRKAKRQATGQARRKNRKR